MNNIRIRDSEFQRELEVAVECACSASEAILEIYDEGFDVELKEDKSPLTQADKSSNDIIVKALMSEFPDHAMLSEEEKDDKKRLDNSLCFVVDPLDGTKEFVKRNGEFTVNIALAKDHESVMGVIMVPVTGELFYAAKGKGAWYRKKGSEDIRIHVSDRIYRKEEAEDFRVVASRSHNSPLMEDIMKKYGLTNVLSIGSSLKGCLVAQGKAEIYYRHNPTMEWDTAAMQCIVEEAGGIFRQMDDSPMRYNRENSLNEKGFYVINRIENRF